MRRLSEAKVGETVKIKQVIGDSALKRRIMDMGLTNGTEIYIRKVAPLGDPMQISLRGYELSVRKEDVQFIEIED